MAAIEHCVTSIADMAEKIGYRVWFDYATCYIHRMRGGELARFEMDNQQNYWMSGELVHKLTDVYGAEFLDWLKPITDAAGEQSRKGLYVLFDTSLNWWNLKEYPDGTGVETIDKNSRDAMYTERGVKRLKARYDSMSKCIPVEVAKPSADGQANRTDNDGHSGQNNPEGNNNNFFRSNF